MNKVALFVVLALVASALAIHEIPMKHKIRSPRETKRLIEYMSRGPLALRINKILAKIFPSEMTPNIYAYPEVKILNYLDAQYYGYPSLNLDRSTSDPLLNSSELSSIPDHPTCGSPRRSADCPPLATSTDTTTLPRAQPINTMVPNSTSPTAQEPSQDLSARTQSGSLDLKPKILFSPKSLLFTESASLLPNSTVFWVWPGPPFQ